MDADTSKSRFPEFNLDPALAEAAEAAPEEQILEGILRLEDPDQVPPQFSIVSRFHRICTGRFAAGHTWTIRRHPNVISLKAARSLGIPDEGGDLANLILPKDTGTPATSSLPFRARGCIVAALDFGLDFAHPNFLNSDGTTRLVGFWHQGAPYDPARPNRFGYGRVYSQEEINAALRASDPYQALGYHPAISDTGNGSHGTHTLDIAAGNGRANGARAAAAAEAELIFVHLSTPRLGIEGDLGDSVRVLEALDYVNTTAGGRPWVVNLSVGRTAGSHDGTSPVEQGMHELLRMGPNRAIVQSAGNYRSADLAVEGWLRDGEHRDLEWIIDPADTTANEIDAWYSGKDRFVVAIRPPQASAFVEVKLGKVAEIVLQGLVIGRIYHRKNDPNNRDNHIEVFLYPGAPSGIWTVRLISDYVVSGRFHAWIERDLARPGAQSRFDGKITTQSYTLGTIATSPWVITVGAYDANAEAFPSAPFSSCGPTRDERRDKPELLAPGVEVVAARSIPRGAARQEGLLVARSGTSMATPHVTGTVAAMLQSVDPPVSIDEIRDCLQRSAEPVKDDEHPDCCAWGRLNTAGAIREIRGLKEAGPLSEPRGEEIAPLPLAIAGEPASDFAVESEEQVIEVPLDEASFANRDTSDSFLDRAEQAVRSSTGGRRQSEALFMRQLMSGLGGNVSTAGLSPAKLFQAALRDGPLMRSVQDRLRVLAIPSQQPDSLRPGDWILRAVPGTGDVGHVSVLASDDLLTPSALSSEGIAAESAAPGQYGLVIEAGAFFHTRSRPFARRLLDSRGCAPPHTMILRPEYPKQSVLADFPRNEPASTFELAPRSRLPLDERGQPLVEGEYAARQGERTERLQFVIGGHSMNSSAVNRFLDRAERALRTVHGGRRQSEASFLQGLLRELGAGASPGCMSPAELFRTVLYDRPSMQSVRSILGIVAMPSQRPDALRPGDWMLRVVPGIGDVGHVSVLASGDLLTPSALASEGIAAESAQPGQYGLVIEAGAFPHSRSAPFARRLLDSHGRVPRHTLILRPQYPDADRVAGLPAGELEPEEVDGSDEFTPPAWLKIERRSRSGFGQEEREFSEDVAAELASGATQEPSDSDEFTPPAWLKIERRSRSGSGEAEHEVSEEAFMFDPTAAQTDFGPKLRKAWHALIQAAFKMNIDDAMGQIKTALGITTAAAAKQVRFFSQASRQPTVTLSEANVIWRALPTSAGSPSAAIYKKFDEPEIQSGQLLRNQDEYCEWTVFRDSAKKIVRVVFSSEPPEYYNFLYDPGVPSLKKFARQLLVRLYQERCGTKAVTLADLETSVGGVTAYNRGNKWNNGHCVHLQQPNNTLGAQVNIAARAAIVRSDSSGVIITSVKKLIACDPFGVPSRQSDPNIGDSVNKIARENRFLTLANPVGLYMTSLDTSGWTTPDGTDAKTFWKVLKGRTSKDPRNSMIVRAEYAVPASKGYTVSDIKIGGVPIEFGSQIAEQLEMRLGALFGPKDMAIDGAKTSAPTPVVC